LDPLHKASAATVGQLVADIEGLTKMVVELRAALAFANQKLGGMSELRADGQAMMERAEREKQAKAGRKITYCLNKIVDSKYSTSYTMHHTLYSYYRSTGTCKRGISGGR
jgi:hypothetical protein